MNPTSTLFTTGLASLPPSVLVAGGGALGAWLRYLATRTFAAMMGPASAAFPWATLSANVLGCAAMGLLVGWLARHGAASGSNEALRLLLGVGVLGGFTTFSAFALEFAGFVERGQIGFAALYVAVSLAGGFAALFAGLWFTRGAA